MDDWDNLKQKDAALATLLASCLRKNPAQRPQSMTEVITALAVPSRPAAPPITGRAEEQAAQETARVEEQVAQEPARVEAVSNQVSLLTLRGHTGEVHCCAVSPDGRQVLSGSQDFTLRLWEMAGGREIRSLKGHTGGIRCCAFSPDGQRVLSGSQDFTLRLWEAVDGREIHSLWEPAFCCAFSPDGRRLLSGSQEGSLKLWDAGSGHEMRSFKGHTEAVNCCAFSPDGQRLLSGSQDGILKLWNAANGQMVRSFKGHANAVHCCAFSPGNFAVLSGGGDGTLRLWDLANGTEIRVFRGHRGAVTGCAFSPDGFTLVSGSTDKTLKLWDAIGGDCLHTVELQSAILGLGWSSPAPNAQFGGNHSAHTVAVAVGATVQLIDVSALMRNATREPAFQEQRTLVHQGLISQHASQTFSLPPGHSSPVRKKGFFSGIYGLIEKVVGPRFAKAVWIALICMVVLFVLAIIGYIAEESDGFDNNYYHNSNYMENNDEETGYPGPRYPETQYPQSGPSAPSNY